MFNPKTVVCYSSSWWCIDMFPSSLSPMETNATSVWGWELIPGAPPGCQSYVWNGWVGWPLIPRVNSNVCVYLAAAIWSQHQRGQQTQTVLPSAPRAAHSQHRHTPPCANCSQGWRRHVKTKRFTQSSTCSQHTMILIKMYQLFAFTHGYRYWSKNEKRTQQIKSSHLGWEDLICCVRFSFSVPGHPLKTKLTTCVWSSRWRGCYPFLCRIFAPK